jgi:hypothetical protein
MTGIALALIFAGCVLLSFSLRRHYRLVFADEVRFHMRRWPLRIAGYLLLALALAACIRVSGVAIGPCLWVSGVALASFAQIMLLTYAFRRSRQ